MYIFTCFIDNLRLCLNPDVTKSVYVLDDLGVVKTK